MNTARFNLMLHAARELLRHYHAGVDTDPHTVRWAQTLVAANPTDKRRPSPKTDLVFEALREGGTNGLLASEIRTITGLRKRQQEKLLNKMLHCGKAFALYGSQNIGLYFLTAADRDAAEKATPKKEPKMKIPRLAKGPPPRQSRAKTEPGQGAMTPARKEFNGVGNDPHAKMADKTAKFIARNNTAFNPDLGPALARKKAKTAGKVATRADWAATEPITPPGVVPQICPPFRASHERMATEGVFGAGFQAVGIGRSPLTGKAWT